MWLSFRPYDVLVGPDVLDRVTRDEEQRQHLLQVLKEIGKRQADPLDTPNAGQQSF